MKTDFQTPKADLALNSSHALPINPHFDWTGRFIWRKDKQQQDKVFDTLE